MDSKTPDEFSCPSSGHYIRRRDGQVYTQLLTGPAAGLITFSSTVSTEISFHIARGALKT